MPVLHSRLPVNPKQPGLVCPICKQPVGIIENQTATATVVWCAQCNHWWSLYEADAKAH